MPGKDQQDIQGHLHKMFPVERIEDYVTRGELHRELAHIATAIEMSFEKLAGKMQRWLIGIGAFLFTIFGAGTLAAYTTAIRSIEEVKNIAHVSKVSEERLDTRSKAFARQERWNLNQDEVLRKVDPKYSGMPYTDPPK